MDTATRKKQYRQALDEVREYLTPQAKAVAEYILKNGSISPLEAFGVLGVYRLAARIHELRIDGGISVVTEDCRDPKGKPYARYSFPDANPFIAPLLVRRPGHGLQHGTLDVPRGRRSAARRGQGVLSQAAA